MVPRWASKKGFGQLSASLAAVEGKVFEREALKLIHLIWPQAVGTSGAWSLDRSGIDHIAWDADGTTRLVVQCKGFRVPEDELGEDQLEQCARSVRSFLASSRTTERYILTHNREGRDQSFREELLELVGSVEAEGKAQQAEVWNRQRLLRESFDAVQDLLLASVREPGFLGAFSLAAADHVVERVPMALSLVRADQNMLKSHKDLDDTVADPGEVVFGEDPRFNLLLGEFGFGKTTALVHAISRADRAVLYYPGALVDTEIQASKDFLLQFVEPTLVFPELDDEDRPVAEKILRGVVEHVLKDPSLPVVLAIDGLDESAFLNRRGGLQHLFNVLRFVEVPVVLAMRWEFWQAQQNDFATVVGQHSPSAKRYYLEAKVVRLLPWTADQIHEFVAGERERVQSEHAGVNLDLLAASIRNGSFQELYADIPRRPLFLKMIVDSVCEHGLPGARVGRAALLAEWARLKTSRDVSEPARRGGRGRAVVLAEGESTSQIVEACWKAMVAAAATMVEINDGAIELLPSTDWTSIRAADRDLERISDPIGLVLHSLLLFAGPRTGVSSPRLRFAHRAFQEFFLAWAIAVEGQRFSGAVIPGSVKEWIDDIEREDFGRTPA